MILPLICCLLLLQASSGMLAYRGPVQRLDRIEVGLEAADLGVCLMVGPSSFLAGTTEKGLFVSISDDVEISVLPANSIVCGYSRGVFQERAEGDKCVGYAYTDCSTGVVFNKQVMSIAECLRSIRQERGLSDAELRGALLGHSVTIDESGDITAIAICQDFRDRYFVPHSAQQELGAINFGMFANDLQAGSAEGGFYNILQLIWRLSWDDVLACAVPTWPVVILAEDVIIENTEPMEIGISYGARYWKNANLGK